MDKEKTPAETVQELDQWVMSRTFCIAAFLVVLFLTILAIREPVVPDDADCKARGVVDCWRSEPR